VPAALTDSRADQAELLFRRGAALAAATRPDVASADLSACLALATPATSRKSAT
jgi:hypothetical protein